MTTLVGQSMIRVLVIDDEPRLCRFLCDSLWLMGCAVKSAGTGEEGVELMKKEEFDVVICDILMPGYGGIWTLEWIKNRCPLTEVVMITGYANTESAEVCQSLGAFSYMTKPFEIQDLRDEIGRAFELRRQKAAALGEDAERTVDTSLQVAQGEVR